MDPIGVTASTIAIEQTAGRVLALLTRWKDKPKLVAARSKMRSSIMMWKLSFSPQLGSAMFEADFLEHPEVVAELLRDASEEIEKIQDLLSELDVKEEFKTDPKFARARRIMKMDLLDDGMDELIGFSDRFEILARCIQAVHQLTTLQRLGDRIENLLQRSDLFARETWEMANLIKDRLADGGREEEEIAKARDQIEQDHPEFSPDKRENTLEDIRTLRRHNLYTRPPRRDPMSFPFIIPRQDADDVVVRVKLDTGSRPNWISKRVLERAGLRYDTAEENLGYFTGASKKPEPFKPLGRVSVTWFSTNQAHTAKSTFLVHDDSLPFDVVLGSKWIIEDLAYKKFMEPVLPMRHIITDDELKEIEIQAIEDGDDNETLIRLQKLQDKRKRDQQRQSKANSKAISSMTSMAPTPRTMGFPHDGLGSISRTRRTSLISNAQSSSFPAQILQAPKTLLQQTEESEREDPSTTTSSNASAAEVTTEHVRP